MKYILSLFYIIVVFLNNKLDVKISNSTHSYLLLMRKEKLLYFTTVTMYFMAA